MACLSGVPKPNSPAAKLWPYETRLPAQIDDSNQGDLVQLFALHHRAPAGGRQPTPEQTNRLTGYAMLLTAMMLQRQGWIPMLDRGPGAEDVATSIAYELVRRSPRFKCNKNSIEAAGHKWIIASWNSTIYRLEMDEVAAMKSKRQTATFETDSADAMDGVAICDSLAGDRREADIAGVEAHLHDEAAQARIIKGVYGDIDAIEELLNLQIGSILQHNSFASYEELPLRMRRQICCNAHALLTLRVHHECVGYASSLQ
jgi:hypothetical protein